MCYHGARVSVSRNGNDRFGFLFFGGCVAEPKGLKRDALLSWLRSETDTLIVAFSRGKDALALLLALLDWNRRRPEQAFRLVAYHCEPVPGLRFVRRSLERYRALFPDVPILNLPHPNFYNLLYEMVFQPPGRGFVVGSLMPTQWDMEDVHRLILLDQGLPDHTFVVMGVRAADSPERRLHFITHGAVSQNYWPRRAYPIWDYTKQDVIRLLVRHRVPLPIDYRWFGRTMDGIDYRFLEPLRRYAPDDYERVRFWFPLIEVEFYRREWFAHDQHAR